MSSTRASQSVPTDLYASPVAAALLTEALALVGDGVPAADVERAAIGAGMPLGPLAIIDAMSLDVIDHALHEELHALEHGHDHDHDHDHDHGHAHAHGAGHEHGHGHGHAHSHDHGHSHPHVPAAAHRHAHSVKSRRMPESAVYVLEKMAHGFKRTGTAAGAGFYDHGETPARLWSGLKTFERRSRALPQEAIVERLTHAAALAALSARDGVAPLDLSPWFGTALPTDGAGATRLASADPASFVARSRALAAKLGPRFEPSPDALARLGVA